MILLTDDLRERLLANGRDPGADHVPVVKFFNPLGEGVWLATELDGDGDTLYGLADLGDPEIGSFSLLEMTSVPLPFGMGIERDILLPRTCRSRSGPRLPVRRGASARPSASPRQLPVPGVRDQHHEPAPAFPLYDHAGVRRAA